MLTNLEQDIRKELITFVKIGDSNKSFVRYKALADKFQIPYVNTNERNDFHKLLDDINRYEVEQKRPLLSVVVVNETYMPGKGFFRLAMELKLQKLNIDDDAFALKAREELFEYWKSHEDREV